MTKTGNNSKVIKKILIILIMILIGVFLLPSWYFYEGYIYQATLPEHAKDLPWDMEKGSQLYNDRIQSEYKDGLNANVLTSTLIQKGYTVSLVASQEKEENKPYCSSTWWDVSAPRKSGERITSNMGSHSQTCLKTERMQADYEEGMTLSQLITQLEANSFETQMSATLRKGRFPCGIKWNIHWNEDTDHKAQNITGSFAYNCL